MAIACVSCHARKVRCVIENPTDSCNACKAMGEQCNPRVRKRRRLQSKPGTRPETTSRWPAEDGFRNTRRVLLDYNPISVSDAISHPLPVLNNEAAQQRLLQDNSSVSSAGQHTSHSAAAAYIGRDHYLGHEDVVNEETIMTIDTETPRSSELQPNHQTRVAVIKLWNGFHIPPRAVRQSLIDSFLEYCHPWTPVLDPYDVSDLSKSADGTPKSMLLAQSVWMAGSRFSSSPSVVAFATTSEFYNRARALFWSSVEDDVISAIKASVILQWFNPLVPEKVSFDNSEFWLKIGVGLAHQLGLHRESKVGTGVQINRKLWWTLVARDSLISFAHGRPRAINAEDCDIRPLTAADISEAGPDSGFQLFASWVDICTLLGTVTESCMRRHMSPAKRGSLELALRTWARGLTTEERGLASLSTQPSLFVANRQNFQARQMILPYYTSVIILCRSSKRVGCASLTAAVAASLSARIFEDFLARDEIKLLAPVHTRFCLVSCMGLVALMPYARWWAGAQEDLQVLQLTLTELAKRWGAAVGASKMLVSIIERRKNMSTEPAAPHFLDRKEIETYFEGVDLNECRIWDCLRNTDKPASATDPALYHTTADLNETSFDPRQVLEHQTTPGFDMMEFGQVEDWILDDSFMS